MIHAVTGLNGAGKTSYAAGLLQAWQKKGVKTAANIGVKGAQLVRNFEGLLELRDCVLLVDEVTAVASSRQFASLTPEALLFFQTLRHSNIGLIWTAPTYDRADLALRSLTLYWTHMMPLVRSLPKGGIWANTHVSFMRSGRPVERMDGPTIIAPLPGLYMPSRHHAVYDSFADVDLFTRSIKFPRTCPSCGVGIDYGRRRASLEPVSPELVKAAYYCPSCSTSLGSIDRAASQNIAQDPGRIALPPPTPSELVGVNPPSWDFTPAGAEHLPDPFDQIVFGIDADGPR